VRLTVGLLLLVLVPDPRPLGAQSLDETIEKVRVCSLLSDVERRPCLEKVFRDMPLPPAGAPARLPAAPWAADNRAADTWIVSETTSPVDYSPVIVATASSGARPDGPALRLSIECRARRTDLVLNSASLTQPADGYSVSYAINGSHPVPVAVVGLGAGLAIKADVINLLTTLPDQGDVMFHVDGPRAIRLEGRFALPALKDVRERLATPCRWRPSAGRPAETPNGPFRSSP
jgi:hypothetical protein